MKADFKHLVSAGAVNPNTDQTYVVAMCSSKDGLEVGDKVLMKSVGIGYVLLRISNLTLHSIYMDLSDPGHDYVILCPTDKVEGE